MLNQPMISMLSSSPFEKKQDTHLVLLCLMVPILLLSACGSDEPESDMPALYRSVDVTPERVLVIEEDHDLIFGRIGSLTSDSDGDLYVGDNQMIHIKHFDRNGDFVGTIGREGRGPGEFSRITNMFIARDTLYAYDFDNARLGRFVKNTSGILEFDNYLDIEMTDERHPRGVLKSKDHYVVESFTRSTEDRPSTGQIALLGRDGTVMEPDFLDIPVPERVMITFDGMSGYVMKPFYRSSHYRLTPDDYFYYGWNDDLSIDRIDMAGRVINTIRFDVDPRPVTRQDISELSERYPEQYWSSVRQHIPDTKPAFTNFLVDEHHRVWVNLSDIEHEDADKWIVLNQENDLVASFDMIPNIYFYMVRDGLMYGIERTEEELQRIVLYEVAIDN